MLRQAWCTSASAVHGFHHRAALSQTRFAEVEVRTHEAFEAGCPAPSYHNGRLRQRCRWTKVGIPFGYLLQFAGKIHPFFIGKPSINGPFSMTMLNNQRVIFWGTVHAKILDWHECLSITSCKLLRSYDPLSTQPSHKCRGARLAVPAAWGLARGTLGNLLVKHQRSW